MRYDKLDPELIALLDDYDPEQLGRLSLHSRSIALFISERSSEPVQVSVFIRCKEDAYLEHLNQHGVIVNQSAGRVRTALLPLESLEVVSEDDAVDYLTPSHYVHLLMDVAPSIINLPQFIQRSGLTGKGVIIGVIDSGIDPNNPAFAGRILSIWDQTANFGLSSSKAPYGTVLTGKYLTYSRDTIGHGTHVAGIAAGDDKTFCGVAPEADLVIVKFGGHEQEAADGIDFIFGMAKRLERPAVINLSLGAHYDAHDGSDSFSDFIDSVSGPGRIVCCAAGNEGNDDIHAQTCVQQGEIRTLRLRVPTSSGNNAIKLIKLKGWYSGKDSIEVAVRSPSGFQTPFQGVISTAPGASTLLKYNLPEGLVRISTPDADPFNHDYGFLIMIEHPTSYHLPVYPGLWWIVLRGVAINDQGRVDAWVTSNTPNLDINFAGAGVNDEVKIGSPGAARQAITVASYTSKVQWSDANGNQQQIGVDLKTVSDFSSNGPLRNGEKKPDLAAPGAMIVSALSADSNPLPEFHFDLNGTAYMVQGGTSMAAPFVTGILALLLQRDCFLSPSGARALLRACCSIPNAQPNSFDPKWGFGLIDASGL